MPSRGRNKLISILPIQVSPEKDQLRQTEDKENFSIPKNKIYSGQTG